MNNSNKELSTIYSVSDTNDQGYYKTPLCFFPIKAAAEAEHDDKYKGDCYKTVRAHKCLRVNELYYLVDREINDAKKVIETIPTFTPVIGYENYVYEDRFDKSVYFKSVSKFEELLCDKSLKNFRKIILFRTDENYYTLEQIEPVKLTPFVKSQKIAIKHAMGKLTEEEQKLLGLK